MKGFANCDILLYSSHNNQKIMGEKFSSYFGRLISVAMLLVLLSSCHKNDGPFLDNTPFKINALAVLTDQIPYQALGSGKIVFERIDDPDGSGFYVIDIEKNRVTVSG
jgi:hypothetical protein